MFVVRRPGLAVAVDTDLPVFSYPRVGEVVTGFGALPNPRLDSARAVVELQQNRGGALFRALLGGEFVPGDGGELAVRVASGAAGSAGHPPGLLGGGLAPGLPQEFADPVADGIADDVRLGGAPSGVLLIDRGGFDRESSPLLFMAAGRLLLRMLLAISRGTSPEPVAEFWAERRGALPAWPPTPDPSRRG
ncbi:hypothetical protein GCM10009760_40390 [Kitasatospora kazusensis]|uniref:Uncharacterized protein n=1 Tax=Kitasatospora kazusensis TaxID=407974 RepID=A0ABN2ZWA7_9ACTN